MAAALATCRGLWRSVRVYHFDRAHHRAMDALHRRWVRPGDLVFDIGAHVGDRTSSFRRLGARVVALEPQAGPAFVLRLLHGRDRQVTLLRAAAGAREGEITLNINSANPTVSTASHDFVRAADGAAGWEGQVWDETARVPLVTLDGLIARFGRPAFVKIDVEGYEDEVLAGLGEALPALSFEFTTIARDVAGRCVERLGALGDYRFNVSPGESQTLAFAEPVDGAAILAYLAALPHEANSGDVYAFLEDSRGVR
nr:FkbM family methyltransferase [Alsobacter ponti]